jgi:hypothetical protein
MAKKSTAKPKAKAKPKAEPAPEFTVADDSKPLKSAFIGSHVYLQEPFPGQVVMDNDSIRISGDRFSLAFRNGMGVYRVIDQGKYHTHGELISATWSTPPEVDDA